MNERINELAEQAMAKAVAKNFTGEKLELRMPSEAWTKEFAELIVKECILTVENSDGDTDYAIWKIKKDFGIEGMNQRLRELYEQAHEQKPTIVMDPISCQPTHKIGNGGVPMYRTELNPDKFAELIVKECVNIARTKSDALIEKGLKYAEDQDEEISIKAAAWQLLVLAQEIKRHFGVY